MDIKSSLKGIADKEKANHYIVNIMMVALFSLILLLTFFGGVKVDIGSTIKGDERETIVRQSYFQLLDSTFSSSMSQEEAQMYVIRVNDVLYSKYGVMGWNLVKEDDGATLSPYENLGKVYLLARQMRDSGHNPNNINWIKYRYAYAKAIDANSEQERKELMASWDGHMAVTIAGEAIYHMFIDTVLMIICIVMLVFSIMALVRKKPFKQVKLAIILLLICTFARFLFSFSFLKLSWTGVTSIVLIMLCTVIYGLIAHMMLDKRDFSFTMFIHNGVMLLGTALSFILLLSPVFRIVTAEGVKMSYNWAYIFDLALADLSYTAVPMSYMLTSLLITVLLMLPVVLNIILLLILVWRFLGVDYRRNEKKIFLIITLVVNVIVWIILAAVNLNIASLYFASIKLNLAIVLIQPLVLAGLIVFEYVFKPKPVKKELVLR